MTVEHEHRLFVNFCAIGPDHFASFCVDAKRLLGRETTADENKVAVPDHRPTSDVPTSWDGPDQFTIVGVITANRLTTAH